MRGSAKRKLGALIKRLRRSRGMSQQALALAVGVHVNTVARWERDGIEARHDALPLIAAALECPLEQLTGSEPGGAADASRQMARRSAEKRMVVAQYVAAYRARLP